MGAIYYSPCVINVLQFPGMGERETRVDTLLQLTPDIQTSLRVRQLAQLPKLGGDIVQCH
jgi:hypothetical protein